MGERNTEGGHWDRNPARETVRTVDAEEMVKLKDATIADLRDQLARAETGAVECAMEGARRLAAAAEREKALREAVSRLLMHDNHLPTAAEEQDREFARALLNPPAAATDHAGTGGKSPCPVCGTTNPLMHRFHPKRDKEKDDDAQAPAAE